MFCQYKKNDGINFKYKCNNRLIYRNGSVVAAHITKDPDMLEWLKSLDTEVIMKLEFLVFDDNIPDTCIPYIEDIAKINPFISVCSESKDNRGIEKLFTPRWSLDEVDSKKQYNYRELEFMVFEWAAIRTEREKAGT